MSLPNRRKVAVPLYGTQETWGGGLAKKASQIKQDNFKAKVHKCDRLDKTLVY